MTSPAQSKKNGGKKSGWLGVAVGAVLTLITVLASGFMIETTNTDTFCVTCHVMTPFQTAWKNSVHGGKNPQGLAAQCVDCHLPHGNFFEFLTVKAATGASDIAHNFFIDGKTYDWAGAAEKNRLKFTFDSACRRCHQVLTPPGMKRGGFIAHRTYLLGETKKKCAECHPHVGHKNMLEEIDRYFNKNAG